MGVVISVLLILTGLFYYYKDDIGRTILLRVNSIQPGELAFDDIAFNPFAHLPNISIELNDVDYFEHKNEDRGTDTLPIIKLEKLYIAFDVIDLIKGNVNVSQIILKNGEINLITYADSSFNLTNAFNLKQDTLSSDLDTANFNLDLKRIALKGVFVSYNNMPNNTTSSYSISSLDASLNIQDKMIKSELDADIKIIEINQSGGFLLSNKQIGIESSLSYDKNFNLFQIEPSKLSFDKADFIIDGSLDISQSSVIDVSVVGNDKDFSVLSLFLSKRGMKNVKSGDLYFNGTIKGELTQGIPFIDFSFGMDDVEVQIPNTTKSISKMGLTGVFKSGAIKDLSKAELIIKDIKANLPGGNMSGQFSIQNFVKPVLDIDFNMTSDIYGLDQIFNIEVIDSLEGKIIIDTRFNGSFDDATSKIVREVDTSSIVFKNVSFNIPEVNQVRNVNGKIRVENDTTYLDDFNLEIGTSDFNINGSLTNLFSLILNVDDKIDGSLKILSDTYDFPDFFKYDSVVATSFPYQIEAVNLNVNVLTSTSALTNFIVTPRIVFDIRSLKAEIKDFLPPVKINDGVFTLGLPFDFAQGDSSLNLDFSNFNIEVAGSNLITDVVFNSPKTDPNWLKVDLEANNLNPQKTFVYWSQDSIPNYLNGRMDGSMNLNLVFSNDSIAFDKLDFNAAKLEFVNAKDTFDLGHFNLTAKEIDYKISNSSNFMETLSFEADLSSRELLSNHFEVEDLNYNIKAKEGVFRLTPINNFFFDQKGEGLFVLKPFEDPPRYEIKYKVEQFEVSKLFSSFQEDTIVSGKMDLDVDLVLEGSSRTEIEHNLNGRVLLKGKELTFYGLDLDKVIDRFKRSQKFTLADVGAVVLMGPAGLLVTKGSDFASIVVLNPGESSKVVELSSDWDVNNGVINLVDVAFTTLENRMAFKGWVDLVTDSLSVEVALLNELGCSLYSQEIFGPLDSIESSKVKVMKSLLAPVTNLVTSEKKCDVFYDGKVNQPEKEK